MRRWILPLAAVCAFGQQKSFVACPIVRDTRTVPCFVAEYDGETYFIGTPQSEHVPQLKHEVLVEGRVSSGPRVCGGLRLDPVSVSVLPEVNLACNLMLPAEPGIEAPTLPARPSTKEPSSGPQEFVVLYQFDDDRPNIDILTQAAAYAKKAGGTVTVSGSRATSLLSDGRKLIEHDGLAERRANAVAEVLRGLGVKNVTVEAQKAAAAADGQNDASKRRVVIAVTP
jgi:hypothetical protein